MSSSTLSTNILLVIFLIYNICISDAQNGNFNGSWLTPAPIPMGTLSPTTSEPTTAQPTTPQPTTPAPVTPPTTPQPTTASPTTAIANLLSALKQQISAKIQELVSMTVAQLNGVLEDNDVSIDTFAAMLTTVDQATDNDGSVTVVQLLQVLNNVAEPKINAIVLGFVTVLDSQQQLAIAEIKNFLSTENPLIRAAIQQTIRQRQMAVQASIAQRTQAAAAQLQQFKLALTQVYNDGLATFAQELQRYKLGEFSDIGPDVNGEISTDQLIEYASGIILMSDDDIRQLCLIADPSGRGKVNFAQFAQALSAQYLAKSIVTSLFEAIYAQEQNVESFVDENIPEIFGDDDYNYTNYTNANFSAVAVVPGEDMASAFNQWQAHGKGGSGHASYFVMDGLTVLVIVLAVVVFAMFMCMVSGGQVCSRRKYSKTLEDVSDVESEDDRLIS